MLHITARVTERASKREREKRGEAVLCGAAATTRSAVLVNDPAGKKEDAACLCLVNERHDASISSSSSSRSSSC